MYRRLGEASCQPTTAAGIRVCVHNRVGRVEVTSDDELDRWLVLRVGGPHPQISLFERTAPRSWRANFKLCRAGRYTIHVRAMMAQQPWLEWSANWTAHPTRPPCAGPWYAGVLLPQHIIEHDGAASTTSCAGGLWSWPDSNEYRSAAGTMLEQITPAPHPNRTSLQTLFGSLRFTEPSPRRANAALTPPPIQPPANNAASSLIICVVGDSQMRTLADGIVQHLVESGKGGCSCSVPKKPLAACPKNPTGAQTCKRIVCAGSTQNVSVHYFRASYGNELATQLPFTGRPTLTEHLGRQCSVALFNSGQWWASWKKKPKPPHTALAPGEYATHVEALMAQLKTIRVPVAWVATNPYPINAGGPDYTWSRARPYDMSLCPPGERRFLHVLQAYNRHAKRLAAVHGLDFVDTWQIALPLFDVSADGAHYAWLASPVGKPKRKTKDSVNLALEIGGGAEGLRRQRRTRHRIRIMLSLFTSFSGLVLPRAPPARMAVVDDFAISKVIKEVRVFDGSYDADICEAVAQVGSACIEEKGSFSLCIPGGSVVAALKALSRARRRRLPTSTPIFSTSTRRLTTLAPSRRVT